MDNFLESESIQLLRIHNGALLLFFNNLKKYDDMIKHTFTTRLGGVSLGEYASLNMGFNKKDSRENVMENYRLVAEALGVSVSEMVLSNQVHDNKIRKVGRADIGKGIMRESDIIGYDGLITDEPGVVLVTFYADCVPIYFFDPVKKVIALVHSGWKSTLKEISKEAVNQMVLEYGSKTCDIIASVGPSIGPCCFEVDEDVYDMFLEKFDQDAECLIKKENNKWHIDMWNLIHHGLLRMGISNEHISISQVCTKCNHDIFFSHRGDFGKTGIMAAMLQLVQ